MKRSNHSICAASCIAGITLSFICGATALGAYAFIATGKGGVASWMLLIAASIIPLAICTAIVIACRPKNRPSISMADMARAGHASINRKIRNAYEKRRH